MEDNQIKNIQALDILPTLRSAWPESIVPQVPPEGTPHTLGSLQSFLKDSYCVYHLPTRTVIISTYEQPLKGESFFEEQMWADKETNRAPSLWSYGSPVIQNDQYLLNTGPSNADNLATMADIALENRPQTDYLFDDAPADDISGIFPISRSPKVIFSTSFQLSSILPKRKPFISPHDLSLDEE